MAAAGLGAIAARLAVAAASVLPACGGEAVRDHAGPNPNPNPSSSSNSCRDTGDASAASSATEHFEDENPLTVPGLWTGTGIGESLDRGLPIEADPLEGDFALHVQGVAGAEGADILWHTPLPIEHLFASVRFSARSPIANSELTVTIGGPSPRYWQDIAEGIEWPASRLALTAEWQPFEVDFAALGFGPNCPLSPHSSPFGAVHFAMPPNAPYDLWLDEVGVRRALASVPAARAPSHAIDGLA